MSHLKFAALSLVSGAALLVSTGASLAEDTALARKTRALKVAGDDLPDYIERLARTYLDQRDEGESFALWVRRADEEDIR